MSGLVHKIDPLASMPLCRARDIGGFYMRFTGARHNQG